MISGTAEPFAGAPKCFLVTRMISRQFLRPALFLTLAFALHACGGGGGSATAPAVSTPVATPGANTPATASASLRIVVPQAAQSSASVRRPAFVSAAAQSIVVDLYTVAPDGTFSNTPASITDADLTPSSNACSGTPLACTITLAVPIGTVTVGAALYAGTHQTGAVLATFAPSSLHEFRVVPNATNTIGISLDGIPASLSVNVSPATVTAGTASTSVVTVTAHDAAANLILGTDPYASAVTLTNGDGSGHTSLSGTLITSPASSVNLVYNGLALSGGSFTIGASYPAQTPVSASATVGILSTNGVTAVPGTLAFLSTADTPQDVTYGEASYAGTFTISDASCSAVATVVDNIGTLHITPVGAGSCAITITDTAQRSATVNVTVNVTTFGAQ